jgi:hypothetical protein
MFSLRMIAWESINTDMSNTGQTSVHGDFTVHLTTQKKQKFIFYNMD